MDYHRDCRPFHLEYYGRGLAAISINKRLSNVGAAFKLLLIGLFVVLALIFFMSGHASGAHMGAQDLLPSSSLGIILSGIIPVMLFKWQGFEVQVNVGDEVDDPQRTVPRSMLTTGGLAFLAYVIPIVVTIFALNKSQVAGSSGLLQAIANVTIVLPHTLILPLKWLLVPILIVALGASGSTWMVSANRAYAIAAKDHVAPQSLARFNPRTNAPSTAIIVSGLIATCAMILAVLINSFGAGTLQSLFTLVLGFTVSVNTLAYLFIFPDLLLLRYKQPAANRPYRVPGGVVGAWLVSILSMFYTIIVSYFLLFPASDAIKSSGVSRLTYEVTQLVALGSIILLTVLFYLWGRRERRQDMANEEEATTRQPLQQEANVDRH
ncbi:hypothetical protein KDK_78400 [Dictyobacter kobayashii]|uniref:Amino acid permease n=1 Tax=Dictyobacter kobayashii TaxID=2014872 RepID=A0A402AY33_9CHLR|nr:APC family permease [Dictyobacter kobayashii]GCE24040.1 hypothetical protein KDK_78400 [Dictyobacter kobayashii]